MAEFSWIVSLNPRLERLELIYTATLNLLGRRLLSKAISGLSQLTTLDITVCAI